MIRTIFSTVLATAAGFSGAAMAAERPTIVLVHGAFADASGWNGVTAKLHRDGYHVIAAANPLRSVKSDAASVTNLLKSIKGPVVLVGHSYGGAVISEAAEGQPNVASLVYVAAFSPDEGESAAALTAKFPGSTVGPTLAPPVPLADGGNDLYIDQAKFPVQFAADVPNNEATFMAVNQRPIKDAAFGEPASAPAWKHIPSWHIYGDADKMIPPKTLAYMAERAKAKKTVVVPGGSHAVMISHPAEVAAIIEAAAGK
jgi:pimeloyl-ACP methyl ester carboxylesterase